MLFTTPNQFLVLLLMLVVGWLFGLASHPGGRKWKRSYQDEKAARAADVAQRDARISELEAANSELTRTRPGAAPAVVAAAPAAVGAATRAGAQDDLTRLRGVDAELARRFEREGVGSFAALAALTGRDEAALESRIDLPAGFITRERLPEQARLLADGQGDEFASRFG